MCHMKQLGSKLCELEDSNNELQFSDRKKKNNVAMCIMLIVVGGTLFSTS